MALVAAHSDGGSVDLALRARKADLGADLAIAAATLYRADRAFAEAFGVDLLDSGCRNVLVKNLRAPAPRKLRQPLWFESDAAFTTNADLDPAEPEIVPSAEKPLSISAALWVLLDEPPPTATASHAGVVLDGGILAWISVLRVAAGSGMGGHLVLRCRRSDDREVKDLATALPL